jgi:hypothetical protein
MKKHLGQKILGLCQKVSSRLPRSNESGAALIASILFAATISVLAVVAFQWATGDIKRTGNYVVTREAFYIAEAGLQKSLNYLNYDSNGDYPGEAGQGFTTVLDTFLTDHTAELVNFSFGGGTYTVSLADNDDNDDDLTVDVDNTILLNSTGTKDAASVTIQAVILHGIFGAKHAITTEANLTINGNPTVQGTFGSIHSNADIVGNSNNVEQGTTAAGVCDSPCVAAAKEVLPIAEPEDFKSYANFILTSAGAITDVEGSTVDISENKLDNWSYTDTGSFEGWTLNGCSANGMFYAETSIKLTGNVDKCVEGAEDSDKDKDTDSGDSDSGDKDKDTDAESSGDALEMTLIAEGDIIISGNPNIENYKNALHPEEIQNLLFVSGLDLDFGGNLSQSVEGIAIAKEQISLTGSASLSGYVIASDVTSDGSTVNGNTVSGNFTITYNSLKNPFLNDQVTLLSWKEK